MTFSLGLMRAFQPKPFLFVPTRSAQTAGTCTCSLDYQASGARAQMPILRYFVVVGACLLALLFLTGSRLQPSTTETSGFQIDKSTIRITSKNRTSPPVIINGVESAGF
jgi:hypothetical protein